ncbi:MAG: S1 RNA-binding domain-containing protein [SAR202 cluster bacterium]|nr:S1 RNA-binding domain-containing protein [SAR202 cluster bacterium]
MAELLGDAAPFRELRRGEVVEGQIMRVDQDGILVSVGHKSEGIVPPREMRTISPAAMGRYRVGAVVPVYVLDPSGLEGAVLSLDRARGEEAWTLLEQHAANGEPLKAVVVGHNKGGAIVDIEGVQAFVPLSQVVLPASEDHEAVLTKRIGQEVTLKVLEVNRKRNRAVLSERQAVRERREGEKDRLLESLHEGEVRTGRVTGVSNFGAFVDIGGADGLIHVSELSWAPVTNVEDVVKVGQDVNVYVLRVDQENRRIALSLKRLQPTPWDMAASKFQVGQTVTGTVTRLADFGAFTRVEDAVEGLIHISELTDRHIRHPKEVVAIGDRLTLRVVTVDPARRRLGLSLKQAEELSAVTREPDAAQPS